MQCEFKQGYKIFRHVQYNVPVPTNLDRSRMSSADLFPAGLAITVLFSLPSTP